MATTGGVKALPQGQKVFSALNEEKAHSKIEGDDRNFTESRGESSRTETQERVVKGDDRSGRTETFSSSFQSSSSESKVHKTILNSFDSPDFAPLAGKATDQQSQQDFTQQRHHDSQQDRRESNVSQQSSRRDSTMSEQSSRMTSSNTEKHERFQTVERNQLNQDETTKREESFAQQRDHGGAHLRTSTDSRTVQQAFELAKKPGVVVLRTLDRTKPDLVCITETKQLTDGTKVTTKRFEHVEQSTDIRVLREQYGAIDQTNQSTTNTTNTTSAINKQNQIKQQNLRQENVRQENLRQEDRSSNVQSNRQDTEQVSNVTMSRRTQEAFELAKRPGQVLTRTVERTQPDTVCITEIKELTDGTKVTTKRYERVDKSTDIRVLRENFGAIDSSRRTTSDITRDSIHQQPRQQQPQGQPIRQENRNINQSSRTNESRDSNITEDSSTSYHETTSTTKTERLIKEDHQQQNLISNIDEKIIDVQANDIQVHIERPDSVPQNNRVDSQTTHNETHTSTSNFEKIITDQTLDERTKQAFRLAEQPGKVLSHTVQRVKPDTVCITETKLLTDGTKVTTKRYEHSREKDIQPVPVQIKPAEPKKAPSTSSPQKRPDSRSQTDTKITVDLDKTHESFAQTLRATSPDNRRPQKSTVDHRTSNTSITKGSSTVQKTSTQNSSTVDSKTSKVRTDRKPYDSPRSSDAEGTPNKKRPEETGPRKENRTTKTVEETATFINKESVKETAGEI